MRDTDRFKSPASIVKTISVAYFGLFSLAAMASEAYDTDPTAKSSSVAIPAVDCIINPYQVVDIASPVRGVIDSVYVERSDQVSKGQILAKLAADVERASVQLAQSRAKINSEIKAGEVNLNYDQRYKTRVEALYRKQVVSTERIEEAKREIELSSWKLKQAEELAEVRRLELLRAQAQLGQKTIISPIDGFILDTYKYKGEYVEDQAIMRVAQLDPLIVEAIVPMESFGQIKVGMAAEVHPEIMSSKKLQARVSVVDRIGDTASGTFGVRLVMPNPNNLLPAGIKCVVKIDENSDIDLSSLPSRQTVEEPAATTFESNASITKDMQTGWKQPSVASASESPANQPETAIVNESSTQTSMASGRYNDINGELDGFVAFDHIGARVGSYQPFFTDLKLDRQKQAKYIVLLPQREDMKQTRKLIEKLKVDTARAESGFQVIVDGPYKGFISLGVFKSRLYAKQLFDQVEALSYLAADEG